MKKLIIAAGLSLVLTPAVASTYSPEKDAVEYCNFMASLAHGAAQDRDEGSLHNETTRAAAQLLNAYGEHIAAADIVPVLEIVFHFPYMTPAAEGNFVFDWCLETYQ